MDVVYSALQARHAPRSFLVRGQLSESPEIPARADAFLAAVERRGDRLVVPADAGLAPIAAVHAPDYLAFLEQAWREWQKIGGAPEVIPNVHPGRAADATPQSIVGQAGKFQADTACPIGEQTYVAAVAAAHSAVHAAALVAAGARSAYALCRPPGHHAFADMAGGFCFLNNAAIAADSLARAGQRVAILDVDVHHGNGTQGIFYRRRDVLHVSLHADPSWFYPYFWGYAHERGAGDGVGYNLNLPLALGTDDDSYAVALEDAKSAIRRFAPDTLVVALGLDGFEGDPLKGMRISMSGFERIGASVGALALPTVLVQEGGYPCPELSDNLEAFLNGFDAGS
jgi:acetoin utilization deacetylase AcuC-like enzyme